MHWLPFAIIAAFCDALKDFFSKKNLTNTHPIIAALALRLFALPLILLALFFIEIPEVGPLFWPALIVGGTVNILVNVLYMKALKASDLSLSVPLLTFTPLFMLLTSPIMIGEWPNATGIVGVVFIVVGSWVLNFKKAQKGIFLPFKALLSEKGPRYMLLIAFIWSITANIDKIGIKNSSALFWAICISSYLAIGLIPVALIFAKGHIRELWHLKRPFSLIGAVTSILFLSQMYAMSLTLTVYTISIKRTSALIGVLLGVVFLKEKNLKNKLVAVILMLTGVLLISIF